MAEQTRLIRELKAKCAEVGSNLTEICSEAGVPRQTVQNWVKKEPLTVIQLRKIESVIDDRKMRMSQTR